MQTAGPIQLVALVEDSSSGKEEENGRAGGRGKGRGQGWSDRLLSLSHLIFKTL